MNKQLTLDFGLARPGVAPPLPRLGKEMVRVDSA